MSKITDWLQGEVHSIGITGHIRPDGDCIGSVLGLYHYIGAILPGVRTDMYLQEVPERFAHLPGAQKISSVFDKGAQYDVFFALDSGDLDRIGPSRSYFETAKKTVCIDHHISNIGFAQENHIEPEVGSTCEILYAMMEDAKVSTDAAMCLYLGMAHDTGVFQYANTTPRTMRLAADLMAHGFDHTRLVEDTFYAKTYVQTQVLGRALMESILIFDKRCAFSVMRKREMDFYGVTSDSMEGIVSQLQLIRGVDMAIFLYELESQVYKVSMRSNETVDVSKVAEMFGGGGHKRAAGCTVTGDYHDVINNLTLHIQQQIEENEHVSRDSECL